MKRTLSWLLAGCLTAALLGGCQNSNAPSGESTPGGENKNQIIVGSLTDLNADFMDGWTNAAQNAAARRLINGSSTIVYTKEGQFAVNQSVVENFEAITQQDGSKTFRITLKDGLRFSDGSPISAKDYVFALLLTSSPEFASLDADAISGADLVGYDAFRSGESRTFSGVHLEDELVFSVDVAADRFPYYYELTFASADPLPMAVIAPEVTLKDDGDGAYLSETFTADLLRETILNAQSGYRYAPTVSAGPYRFVRYDPSTKQAVLEKNEYFAGTYDGVQPSIDRIILKSVTEATQMDELSAGQVDLLTKISGGDSINAGLDLADAGKISYRTYLRAGYGRIAFSCNFGPTQFPAVRQAIAYCLDRENFAKQYSGGFAQVVDGYYGLSQWEYQQNKDALDRELTHYSYHLDRARQLLIEDGWTKNAVGDPFVEGSDQVRYKLVDGELMPLVIEWANTAGNPVSDLINTMLPGEMAKVGMRLNATTMEFGTLQENLQQIGGAQNYHMYNLGTGFSPLHAVWYYYNTDLKAYGGAYNSNFIADETLYGIAQEMKTTAPGDTESYSEKWLRFQIRWNELLPDIPLYSDEYHDFYNSRLSGYDPDGLWGWEYAIVYASLSQ